MKKLLLLLLLSLSLNVNAVFGDDKICFGYQAEPNSPDFTFTFRRGYQKIENFPFEEVGLIPELYSFCTPDDILQVTSIYNDEFLSATIEGRIISIYCDLKETHIYRGIKGEHHIICRLVVPRSVR